MTDLSDLFEQSVGLECESNVLKEISSVSHDPGDSKDFTKFKSERDEKNELEFLKSNQIIEVNTLNLCK